LKTPSADAPPSKKQKTGTPSTPTAQPPSRGKKSLPEEPQAGKQPAPTGEEEIKQGDKVAARVSGPTEDNENDMWILASYVKYLADKKKIEVEDEDDDSNQGKKHYKLNKKCVIALPKVFNPNQIHAKGSQVLAMFPNTTTFYPAIIDREASKQSNNFYGLKFEDDEEGGKLVSRKVNFKYVIPLPKK
jgi:SAGA-associated factor 29